VSEPVNIVDVAQGTVFLQMFPDGSNQLGLMYDIGLPDEDDRKFKWICEDGRKCECYTRQAPDEKVFKLAKINMGTNPLRDLLVWRGNFEWKS